jgi:hypothetical protein
MAEKKKRHPIDERVDEPAKPRARAKRGDDDPIGTPGEAPLASASQKPRVDGGDEVPESEQGARHETPQAEREEITTARGPTDPRREED